MKYAIGPDRMREFDSRAAVTIPEIILMENAGRQIAEHLLRDLRAIPVDSVVFLVGTGHNGGDGLVAARHINDAGVPAQVFMAGSDLKPLTRTMLETLDSSMTKVHTLEGSGNETLIELLRDNPARHIFADAFLGSGINRPLSSEKIASLMAAWNESPASRYAVDVPSGSGAAPDWPVFHATCTLAVQFPRDILFTQPLRNHCGEIRCLSIGFPAALLREYCAEPWEHGLTPLLEQSDLSTFLPPLPSHAHKGTRGRVEVFAGSRGMAGAALLAARAALHSGAGMVRLACADEDITDLVLEQEPALMTTMDGTPGSWGNCILAGPGREQGDNADISAIKSSLPLVVDAGGSKAPCPWLLMQGE